MSITVKQAITGEVFSKDYPITVLLIDDQAIVGESVRRMLEDEEDVVYHFCSDPTKALDIAKKVSPTVILQDLVMPDIDGLTLLRYFRANESTKSTPMIVLSSKEEPVVKADAFALGANDYLVKLPDKIELLARIRYHSRGYINLLQRNEAYSKIEENQKLLMDELSEAASYVRSLLPQPMRGDVDTEWIYIPSTQLGGDSFGYHWLDEDHFAVYLLDVCGHGVGAALLSISAMNVINSRSLPETDFYDPGSVLVSLNNRFPMEEQNNKFFTIWYGVYNKKERSLTYASGGHPQMVLLTGSTKESAGVVELKVQGTVIGAMPEMTFETATVTVEKYGKLYVFCDGVYELPRPDGSFVEVYDLIEELSHPVEEVGGDLDRILHWSRAQQQTEQFDDDFSIIGIQFN